MPNEIISAFLWAPIPARVMVLNAASTLWSKLAADNQRFGMIDRLAALIADPRVPARAAPVWLSVKAREFDRTVGNLRGDVQFTAHCRDQVTKSADPHVAAAGQL
jgi:hypothetical protein